MQVSLKHLVFAVLLVTLGGAFFTAQAQKRDHLTDAEIEIVRDVQELDARTKVFVKAVERRFVALGVAIELKSGKKEKDNADWGAAPTGTRAELLADIAKILEEAMSKIDDVYGRDAKNPLIPKSLKILADAAARFQTQVGSLEVKSATDLERGAVDQIKRDLADIIEAQKQFSAAPAAVK